MKINLTNLSKVIDHITKTEDKIKSLSVSTETSHYIHDVPYSEIKKIEARHRLIRKDFPKESIFKLPITESCSIIFVCSDQSMI